MSYLIFLECSSQQLQNKHYFQDHMEFFNNIDYILTIKQVSTNSEGLKSYRVHFLNMRKLKIKSVR